MQRKTLGSCTANHALIDGILNIVNLSLKNCLVHRGTPHFSSTAGILAHLPLLSGAVIEILVIISRERLLFCCKKRKKTKYTEVGQFVICELKPPLPWCQQETSFRHQLAQSQNFPVENFSVKLWQTFRLGTALPRQEFRTSCAARCLAPSSAQGSEYFLASGRAALRHPSARLRFQRSAVGPLDVGL